VTARNRNFLIASAAILVLGLGGAFAAYLLQQRTGTVAGLPAETRYVPATAIAVAYADVRGVMSSDLHRELMAAIPAPSRRGRRLMNEFAGVDLEKEVAHVLAFLEPPAPPENNTNDGATPRPPRGMTLVQGSFSQSRIEGFIKEDGGVVETYNGRSISVRKGEIDDVAVGFVRPDLIAVGHAALVRRALDGPHAEPVATNEDMARLMRDASGGTAWVVGHFDAVRRTMPIPGSVGAQVPAVRFLSVRADVNGGVTARIRAEANDEAGAEQLREVVRGFITLARMQSGAHPQFESVLKSVELTGSDRTVQLSMSLSPEALRSLVPRPSPPQ
jgi:hypothetical protein